jgi:DNA mismatch repair protein MutL
LPSIASVSELTLVTREEEAEAGVKVRVEAGVVKEVSDTGSPRGTEIAVRRLFGNVPARRKFLKSVDTEFAHITTLVSNMALARPDVHFTLLHNGRVIFDLPGSADLSGRLRHALGADALDQLIPVDHESASVGGQALRVHGFISAPSYTRTSSRSLHVFVNRRLVRDRLINHAVFEAYRGLMPKGRYPLVVLFVDLDAAAVDVNVHPSKHEVRFREQASVHDTVMNTLLEALRAADRSGAAVSGSGMRAMPWRGSNDGEAVNRAQEASASGVERALGRYYQRMEADRATPRRFEPGASARPAPVAPAQLKEGRDPFGAGNLPGINFQEVKVIGQVAETFILAETPDSLLIIDQHAAHEKIAYERLQQEFKAEAVARQPLLFPVTVDLTYEEARGVERNQETLLRLGLEVEPFGGNTVAVKALPALLVGADPARLLLEVVDRLAERRGGAVEERLEEAFAVMACHSVVRAHKVMTKEEMSSLVRSMDQAEFPGHCPHGRDAVVRIKLHELAKWFGR